MRLAGTLLVALAVGVVHAAGGQALTGSVIDSASRTPIAGVVVSASDASGAVLARTLSDERGHYRLTTFSASGSIRLQRIGYRPRVLLLPGHDMSLPRVTSLVRVASLLDPVEIQSRSTCPQRPNGSAAMALLEQARASLLSLVVARSEFRGKFVRLVYEQHVDARTGVVVGQRVTRNASDGEAVSFKSARSGSQLANDGFRVDAATAPIYLGPDADAFLDDDFVDAYCFSLVTAESRPSELGLRFVPVSRKRTRVDVDATLWVDTVQRFLREIQFQYLGVAAAPAATGGETFFREFANGITMIDRWELRAPGFGMEAPSRESGRARATKVSVSGGGRLASAQWPGGPSWQAALPRLSVTATIAGKPSAGVAVRLFNTNYEAVTDSTGTASIDHVLPGTYRLIVTDARLASVGIYFPTILRLTFAGDSERQVTVESRTLEEYASELCASKHARDPADAVVLGQVITSGGDPVAEARLTLDVGPQGSYSYVTGAEGTFEFCLGRRAIGAHAVMTGQLNGHPSATVSKTISDPVSVIRLTIPP